MNLERDVKTLNGVPPESHHQFFLGRRHRGVVVWSVDAVANRKKAFVSICFWLSSSTSAEIGREKARELECDKDEQWRQCKTIGLSKVMVTKVLQTAIGDCKLSLHNRFDNTGDWQMSR